MVLEMGEAVLWKSSHSLPCTLLLFCRISLLIHMSQLSLSILVELVPGPSHAKPQNAQFPM